MNKEIISDRQGINLSILFIFGSSLVLGTGGKAKNDTWIAMILAIFASVPVLLTYARILSRYPGKDLFDILEIVFGKYLGKVMNFACTWYSFYLGALVIRNFGDFMNTVGLPETPRIVPLLMFTFVSIFAVKSGIETIAKCSSLFIIAVLSLIFVFAFFTIPSLKPENLLPIMYNGYKPILQGAFSALTFPFGELVVFMMIFDSLQKQNSSYRVYLTSLVIGGLVLLYSTIRNIMVIGGDNLGVVYFPSYTVISRVNIGDFLQRLEISVSLEFVLSGFVKISVCLLAATKGLSKLLGLNDYRILVTPVGILMANVAYILYDSTMEMMEWATDIYPYYAFPFQVILPLIILFTVEIKARMKKKDDNLDQSSNI